MHLELIRLDRDDAPESLLLLEERGLQINELGFKRRFYFVLRFVQVLFRVFYKSYVESNVKKFFLRLLKLIAEPLDVLISNIKLRVAHEAFVFPDSDLALHFRKFFLKLPQDPVRVDRMREYGNVENAVEVDDGREPAFGEEARIRNDKERPRHFPADVDGVRIDFECGGGDDVRDFKHRIVRGFRRKERRDQILLFFLTSYF